MLRVLLERAELFDEICEASERDEALHLARIQPPDLVLCDATIDFVRPFRAERRYADVPLLVMGPAMSVRKVAAFEQGADDWVTKGCGGAELRARVGCHLRLRLMHQALVRTTEDLVAKNRELAEQATTDPLTGIRNRRWLLERAEEELSRARRYERPWAVLAIDVDHFKRINDTFGHPRGDAVLVGVANALRDAIRDTDALARFGGEEFVVVMPETNDGGALEAAERLRCIISHTPFEGIDRPVTISLGVSVYDPEHGSFIDVARMLERADAALYLAKKLGRDRVELADILAAPVRRSIAA